MSIKHHLLALFKNNSTKNPQASNIDATSTDDGEGGGGRGHNMLGMFDAAEMASLVDRGVFKAQNLPLEFSTQLEPSTELHPDGNNTGSDSHGTGKTTATDSAKSGKTTSAASSKVERQSNFSGEEHASGLQSAFGYDVALANSQTALGFTMAGSNLGRHHGNHNGAITQNKIAGAMDGTRNTTHSGVSKLFQNAANGTTQAQQNTKGNEPAVITNLSGKAR